ncbi:LuxR family transcriptional regulator [Streptomyces sp. RerS4]|uniref:helix-turn-helix transcriptional regulator n=1 Tax=Streptomyces sp. RerS4 TaxID=2942449 RepID=UPI00201BDDF5|nr:LuxR family transcriptional regulator [Streptomyces sp. RerS4]UQX05163.1 AAA family ATPase [Streptomyces sp. RerS4]
MLGGVETRSVSPVFVGRADELAVLLDALTRAADGEPQALLIGGEAGVGKTRLTEEFLCEADRRGAVVAVGGCVEIGAEGLPFAPFSTALRALLRRLPDQLAAAAAGQEDELARILPELGETPRGPHDEESTARLFELTARMLERLAADRTVVLVLEDLHWADTSTRHLLAYLLRTLGSGRLVVVATYRADDIHRRHPLRPLLAELDRLRTVRRIELSRFNRAEVRRQLAGILASQPEESFVDSVFDRSDGNAFFVEELVASRESGCRTGLTESLRDLLLVRVEVLPDAAQRVVRTVAEGGSTVEYPLLRAVARLGEDELIEALRAAVGANILLATADGDGYRFRHSLVREAVSDDLLPGERARVNRRYAEAMEEDESLVRAEERVIRLANYWYAANDPAKALPAVLAASVTARRRHAYSEQLSLLERALDLWESVPGEVHASLRPVDYTEAYPHCGRDPESSLHRIDLLAEATVAARFGGERERALKLTKLALRMLEDDGGGPLRAAWFWIERSRLVAGLGRGDGWTEIATAQDLVKGLPPSEVHADVLVRAAGWGMLHQPGPDNMAAAQRAVEYARMVGAEETELNARITVASLLTDVGDPEGGLTEFHAVIARAAELGLVVIAGRAHINLSSQLEALGRSQEAVEAAEQGVELIGRARLLDTEAWVRGNLAESLYSLGRWDEAAEAARRTLHVGQSAATRGAGAARLAYLALARGELTEAAQQLAAAHAHFGDHDSQPQHRLPLYRLAIGVAEGEGRIADVRAETADAIAYGFALGQHRYAWPLLLASASAEADARGLPTADAGRAAALEALRTAARTLATPVPVWTAHAEYLRAELLRAEARDTIADWTAVEAAVRPLDRPYLLARARHRLAEAMLAGGGDREAAAHLLRDAHATADRLGSRRLGEDLALLAQRARLPLLPDADRPTAPVPESDPAEALGLTGREREVLCLVAAGSTNRQIAEELFISPKTASVHVSNILAKLGVAGRGEAAALAHRLRLFTPLGPQPPASAGSRQPTRDRGAQAVPS